MKRAVLTYPSKSETKKAKNFSIFFFSLSINFWFKEKIDLYSLSEG